MANELVLAALSSSSTRVPVLGFAKLFGCMYGSDVLPLHVAEGRDTTAVDELAFREQLQLRIVDGDPVREIVSAAHHSRVGLVVAGAHMSPNGRGPGWSTRELAIRLTQPLLVVPRYATVPPSVERVLVPLEGTEATTAPIRALLETLPFDPRTELVILHTFTSDDMSSCAARAARPIDSGADSFRDRWVPAGIAASLMTACGPVYEAVPEVARALNASLIVLSWSQLFAPGRAALVNTVLADPTRPILLVPSHYLGGVVRPL